MKRVGRVPLAELHANDFVRVEYPPHNILVAIVDGTPCAIEDSCNHAGASLFEGPRRGNTVSCPMHGYIFDLRSGELLRPRRLCAHQRTFVITHEGDDVIVWDPVAITFG